MEWPFVFLLFLFILLSLGGQQILYTPTGGFTYTR